MKKEHAEENILKKMIQGRAAIVGTVVVTVFLCLFTMFEFTALYLEWEIPVLKVMTGGEKSWFAGDYQQEMALDDSQENVPFLENEAGVGESGQSEEKQPKKNDSTGENGKSDDGKAEGKQPEKNNSIGGNEKSDDGTESGQPEASTENIGDRETETENTEEGTENATKEPEAAEQPEYPYYIRINRKQNCVTVYSLDEEGEYTVPYKAMVCSTGLYNATPRGTFRISDKYLWRELYGGVYGQYATRIHGGVLFHSVPYYRKAKNTLCTDKYNKLGQQASMGCVRLTTEDAKWIADNCPVGTTVEIYDDDNPGPLGKPEAEKIDTSDPKKGWDPTDPDAENPWRKLTE